MVGEKCAISDNGGFSLVELIVSVLIMSAIMGIVMMLISSSRATYSEVKTDAVMQTEAGVVRRFMGELAVEAENWGEKTISVSGGGSYKCVYLLAPGNENTDTAEKYYYCFLLRTDVADGILRYGKYEYSDTSNYLENHLKSSGLIDEYGIATYTDPYAVLAEHVSDISVGSTGTGGRYSLMTVTMKLEYNGEQYETTMNFTGRNQ
ncbi:MAG: prepilin-type N-terminal cleavage/methylation domain-containing protein [Lachnospiraceae bacterium]|nr:prepilin-type N-terminal cleavage/methylation domain-containing protein [Lachnospiraceae bacterium]